MSTTLSVQPLDPQSRIDDRDGGVATGIESLRQRVVQAIRFRFGTWFLKRRAGVPYERLTGHARTSANLAAATITAAVREEGGAEIRAIRNVEFSLDGSTRLFRYSADVETVYGMMRIES